MRRTSPLLLLFSLLLMVPASSAQFGKNKVQYENWEWFYLETANFDIYFYEGADDIARFAAVEAERALAQVSREFRYEVTEKIPFIVYKSHNDFQSTNTTSGLLPEGVGGFTEFLKHRVVVPFEGTYDQFRHVIHHELVHAVMFEMLYGRSLASMMGRQASLRVPLWFSEGLAEYASTGWDTKADMFIRDAVVSGSLPTLNYLGGYFAYKGGQSVFRYIGNRYGHEKVGELLGQLREQRDVERAFDESVGMGMEDLDRAWQKAMRKEYWPDIADRQEPGEFARRLTDHRELQNYYNTSPSISPDGSRVAFLSDRNVYADVWLTSTIDPSETVRLVEGQRSGKFEELHWLRPGISWAPDGSAVTFAAKSGHRDRLFIIDAKTGDVQREFEFELDGLFSPSWSPVGGRIAFVGSQGGASDIYYVDLSDGRLYPLTRDKFSDTDPSWSPDGEEVVFISDRGDAASDDLPMWRRDYESVDVYVVSREGGGIRRITDNEFMEETPVWTPDGKHLFYTSDVNGCFNIFTHDLEADDAWPITDVLTGAFDLSVSRDGSKLVFSSLLDSGWDLYEMALPLSIRPGDVVLEPTDFRIRSAEAVEDVLPDVPVELESVSTIGLPGFSKFVFTPESVLRVAEIAEEERSEQSSARLVDPEIVAEGAAKESEDPRVDDVDEAGDNAGLRLADVDGTDDGDFRVQKYSPKFSPDMVYGAAAYSQYFGIVGASQLAVSDILGNHQIYLATNLYFDLTNSDIFASYFYLPNRNDYGIAGFHNAFLWISDDREFVQEKAGEGGYAYRDGDALLFRDRYYGAQFAISRPLDLFRRVEGDLGLVIIGREFLDLDIPTERRALLQPSVAYVSDTILWGITGPMGGGGMRVSAKWSPKLFDDQQSFLTLEADLRRYYLLNKEYSFAFRFYGGVSEGEGAQKFFLGGMQDWINRDYAAGYRIEDIDELYFASFVTPMRGVDYYAQAGHRVALLNAEFRFPLLRYLSLGFPLPLQLGNIRGALFVDAGSAWDNNSDWSLTRKTEGGETMLDDLMLSYGFGARWNLGIFVLKLDAGWQQDLVSRPTSKWYLTLGPEY